MSWIPVQTVILTQLLIPIPEEEIARQYLLAHSLMPYVILFSDPFGWLRHRRRMENFRQANRKVATVEACAAAAESPDAERRRNKAAVIVNAAVLVKQMYNSCTFQS
jgi:hypothetical protein